MLRWTDEGGCRYVSGEGSGSFADRSASVTWVDKFSEDGSAGFERVFQAQHGLGDGSRFGTGQADDTDSAATGWGGYGDYGVVEIHTNILAV